MESWTSVIIAVVCSITASSGFWAYLQKKADGKDVTREMLIGLGHDRLVYLGLCYIERGWITREEFENIYDYLYKPYQNMGGNGTVDRIMNQVNTLPIRRPSAVEMAKERKDALSCKGPSSRQ